MITMGIFPFKEKFPWQNKESNPGPYEHLATRLVESQKLEYNNIMKWSEVYLGEVL
jgi:hypothetical protein